MTLSFPAKNTIPTALRCLFVQPTGGRVGKSRTVLFQLRYSYCYYFRECDPNQEKKLAALLAGVKKGKKMPFPQSLAALGYSAEWTT